MPGLNEALILEHKHAPESVPQAESSRGRKILGNLGWFTLLIFGILLFTVLKLPEERVRNLVQSNVSSALATKGITFSFEEGSLSVALGATYIMRNVTLNFPEPEAPAHIKKIILSPSLLALITGKLGGSVRVENGDGYIDATVAMKNTAGTVSYRARTIDFGKLGILPFIDSLGIKASGLLSGDGNVSGDFAVPSTLNGNSNLKLEKVVIDQQTIMGFAVPRLNISEGKADVSFESGKMLVKTFKLGKSAADDIQATLTGDTTLSRNWDASTVNFKTRFTLSPTIQKAFVLIDALLGQAKQPDGSYAYSLTGPSNNINAIPGAQ